MCTYSTNQPKVYSHARAILYDKGAWLSVRTILPALRPLQRVSGGVRCSSTTMLFSNRNQVKASYAHARDSHVVIACTHRVLCTGKVQRIFIF